MSQTYLRLWVELRTTPSAGQRRGPWHEPRWHGLASTVLRRALGNMLVKGFCPYGELRCQPKGVSGCTSSSDFCQLAEVCPYGVLYAHSLSRRPLFALHVPPFAAGRAGHGKAGVEVTLYGPACGLHGWVLAALARACRGGLGKARLGWEVVEVALVRTGGVQERLCGTDLRRLPALLPTERLELEAATPGAEPTQVEVKFKSPTRLMRSGRLVAGSEAVPCALLVARILDRFTGLYGADAAPHLGPAARREIEQEARGAELLVDETRWLEMEDYSSRHHANLLMGGKVGRLVYGGVGPRLVSILRAGEVLHVGKNPGFGCGRLEVKALSGVFGRPGC